MQRSHFGVRGWAGPCREYSSARQISVRPGKFRKGNAIGRGNQDRNGALHVCDISTEASVDECIYWSASITSF